MKGYAIIHDPTSPASVKRRQFLIDSLRKSGIGWSEGIEGSRMIIRYEGQPKRATRPPVARRLAPPPPVRLEKCLRARHECEPDDVEYWDEMVRLAAEREGATVDRIAIRDGWKAGQWRNAWAVMVSEHLAIIAASTTGPTLTFQPDLRPVRLSDSEMPSRRREKSPMARTGRLAM